MQQKIINHKKKQILPLKGLQIEHAVIKSSATPVDKSFMMLIVAMIVIMIVIKKNLFQKVS